MKSLLSLLRRCRIPAMFILSVMPIALLLMSVFAPDKIAVAWLYAVASPLLIVPCLAAKGRKRLLLAALFSVGLFAAGFLLLPIAERPDLVLIPIASAAVLFFSLPLSAHGRDAEVPPFLYALGIGAHLLTQVIVQLSIRGGNTSYEPIVHSLTAALLLYLPLLFVSLNRISMDNASLSRFGIPASMRRFNTVLTMLFLLLAVLLSLIPAVIGAVKLAWQSFVAAMGMLGDFLLRLLPDGGPAGVGGMGGPMQMMGFGAEATEPSPFALLIEKIMSVVTLVFVVVGSVLLVRMIYRLTKKLARFIWQRLQLYAAAASEDYEDEITDTREDGEIRMRGMFARMKRRAAQADPRGMTPQARIRAQYAKLLRRHPRWSDSSTARENLGGDAASLYERSRYSDHPVTEEEADRFAAGTKRL